MSYNTPVRHLQGGSVLEVASGGTISIAAGGSIQNAGGASYADVTATGTVTGGALKGASGMAVNAIAHGTAVLTNGGSVFVNVGFTVRNAVACVVGLDGTAQSALISAARFANGSVNIYGLGTAFADLQRGTVSYMAFG